MSRSIRTEDWGLRQYRSTGFTPIDPAGLYDEAKALNAQILFKPFEVDQLVEIVNQAIGKDKSGES